MVTRETLAYGAAGAVVFGVTAIATGPVILPLIGFTSGGITSGSAAASIMSAVYTKGVGMAALSAMQSAGALGTVGTTATVATSAVGSYAGILVKRWLKK
ncbi:hypothetical protein Bpfe_008558 [Biomphalaria pfeifferi]|uniref:Uncharacterized protein n=1 Tax=Biomphalaria pfeifferi TaxID=112525 RepID=A0AAD8BWV0_BIOPF|nr:hypothetical protein Bpfe_008558 [Biomphalaria pfeifferi]